MRIHKEHTSVHPTSDHKKSNSSSDSRSFSVQRKPEKNSSQEEEPRTYSRTSYDLLIANVMRSMEARVQGGNSDEMSSMGGVQTKLTVGAVGDKYEQEADQMAQRVMGMESPGNSQPIQREMAPEDQEEQVQTKPLAAFITPLVQREVAPPEEQEEELNMKPLGSTIQRQEVPEEEEEQLQTKRLDSTIQREEVPEEEEEQVQTRRSPQAENGSFDASPNIESQLNSSKTGGSPLPDEVRTFMEPRFGFDFSQVRIHTDSNAVQMNQALGAQAFTHGSDIYFGAGKSPAISDLTAHELTHVVQQTGGVQLQEEKYATNDREAGVSAPIQPLQRQCATCQEEEVQRQPLTTTTQIAPLLSALDGAANFIQRYPVPSNLECAELVDWLDNHSPYSPEWAQTRCTYSFNGQLRTRSTPLPNGGGVEVTVSGHPRLSVSVSCPIDLPQWSPSRRPNRDAEVAAWNRMRAVLDAHEQRHRTIGEQQRAIAENNFRRLNFKVSGSDQQDAMSNATARVAAEQQQWQADSQAAQDAIDPFRGAILSCP